MPGQDEIGFDCSYMIRSLGEDDFPELLAMYRDFRPKHYILGLPPAEEMGRVRWLRALLHEKLNLVAGKDGRIVGHSAIIDVPGTDFCEFIVFVHQDYRNLGIGMALTSEISRRALFLGKRRIWLMVECSNIAAIRIYYRAGFRVVKVYGDVYEMELDIESPSDYMAR